MATGAPPCRGSAEPPTAIGGGPPGASGASSRRYPGRPSRVAHKIADCAAPPRRRLRCGRRADPPGHGAQDGPGCGGRGRARPVRPGRALEWADWAWVRATAGGPPDALATRCAAAPGGAGRAVAAHGRAPDDGATCVMGGTGTRAGPISVDCRRPRAGSVGGDALVLSEGLAFGAAFVRLQCFSGRRIRRGHVVAPLVRRRRVRLGARRRSLRRGRRAE